MSCRVHLSPLLPLLLVVCSCHSTLSWVPDSSGRMVALHREQVRLPGLAYLSLGDKQHDVLEALRAHGFDCSEEAATNNTLACIRPPGKEEPTGGVVMLEFDQSILAGVQAQLQPPGDDSGKLAKELFDRIEQEWTRVFGQPQEVRRPGIVATRRSLRDGTALMAVCYEGEPTLVVEHVQLQLDKVSIPAPPRDSGTR